MIRSLTPDRLFGKASDRRDGSAIEHTLNWSLHSLAGLCSQQQFLRKLKSPCFGFNVNKRSSRNKVRFLVVSSSSSKFDFLVSDPGSRSSEGESDQLDSNRC